MTVISQGPSSQLRSRISGHAEVVAMQNISLSVLYWDGYPKYIACFYFYLNDADDQTEENP